MAVPAAIGLLLSELAAMSLEERFGFILRTGEADLETALRVLRRDDERTYGFLGIERLAWAIAFNVTGEGLPPPRRAGRAVKRSYLDVWSGAEPWSTVWQWLSEPVAGSTGHVGGLIELAASVACECRDDWQYPGAGPVEPADTEQAFSALYTRCTQKVISYVQAKFGRRAGDPQDIASEAWSRVFVDYWSKSATRRVLGGAALSTLVCGAAYFVGVDRLRQTGRVEPGDREGADLDAGQTPPRQVDDLTGRELARHIQECRRRLAARQQIVARMVWDHRQPQHEVALLLGNSDAAVSQLLKRARESMASCLVKRGFSLRYEAAGSR